MTPPHAPHSNRSAVLLIGLGSIGLLDACFPPKPQTDSAPDVESDADTDTDTDTDTDVVCEALVSGDAEATAAHILRGEADQDAFGWEVRFLDDRSGEGADELVISAFLYGDADQGAIYYFINTGLETLTTAATQADARLEGEVLETGYNIETGDLLDADGREELVVSSNSGGVWVVRPDAYGAVRLSVAADLTVASTATSGVGGRPAIGDFDRGGADLVVAATTDDVLGMRDAGRSWLISDSGLGGTAVALETSVEVVDLYAEQESARAGLAANGGDLNGDGADDLWIGAWGAGGVGAAYLFQSPSRLSAARGGALGLSNADLTLTGINAGDELGFPAGLGDIGGTGTPWVALAARSGDEGADDGGVVYLASAAQVASLIALGPTASVVKLTDRVVGTAAGGLLGGGSRSALSGDWNCDGQADLALAAPYADANTGAVYIFYGPVGGKLVASDADVILTGTDAYDRLGSSMDAGDADGDGCDDLLVGAAHSTVAGATGSAYLYLGCADPG